MFLNGVILYSLNVTSTTFSKIMNTVVSIIGVFLNLISKNSLLGPDFPREYKKQ